MKVGIIGCGGMGGALVRGLIRAGAAEVAVFDRHPEKVAAAGEGARPAADAADAARGAEVVIVAVKPAATIAALSEVYASIGPNSLVISVAAGVRLAALEAAAPGRALARAMPNVGAALGVGTTGVALGTHADRARDEPRVEAVLGASGLVRFVKNEADLHAVTALAGSGPAFVLAVLEAMIDGGVAAGLTAEDAAFYARGALRAASALSDEPGADPAAIRARITSPGGTTIAGLAAMEDAGGRGALLKAVAAATDRSRVLGGE